MRWLVVLLYLTPLVAAIQSKFNCPSDLGQQDDTREEFLKRHNNIRQNIALGMLAVNYFSYFLGPAKNIFWHYGFENVRAIEEGVYQWVEPIHMNDFGPKFECHDKIREFCNMAYPTNTRLGCAYERCGSELLISCAYEEGKKVPFKPLLELAPHFCVCKHYPNSACDEDYLCWTPSRNTTIEPSGTATTKTTTTTTRATTTTTASPATTKTTTTTRATTTTTVGPTTTKTTTTTRATTTTTAPKLDVSTGLLLCDHPCHLFCAR
ncbi:unnamed protein product [Nippostrongylus brasiliensis]|uniref:SCP domain-containing protein n=1 Tax=Nippostrongylus brasiliensis TaxID=27835 RepID=A0A0N4YBA7_NIPBR|nr:unnamed protein product [Nippostrongylus brasiliensis]